MRRPLTLALALAACGGPEAEPSSQVPLGIEIRGLTATEVGAVQLTVLSHAVSYNCTELRTTCLRSRVLQPDGSPIGDLVPLKDAHGVEHRALRFGVDGAALLSGAGQTFQARMPPGQNYLLVAEVLSKDSPAKLLASGCNVVAQVDSGDNRGVQVQTIALASPAECKVEID